MESPILTKALVLSSGGMFGAYQAGAWEVLSEIFQPDIVVGASIGSLNGWAVAGHCAPRELSKRWLELDDIAQHRWRFPRSPLTGALQSEQLHAWIEKLHNDFQPQLPYGLVATELVRMRPTLFTTPDITWQHLAASCAIFGVLPQMRIAGRVYTDGGLLHPVPLWAACQMGATDALVINVLPRMPGSLLQTRVRAFRAVAPKPPATGRDMNIYVLEPENILGTPRESIYWSEAKSREWIEVGRNDALAAAAAIEQRFARP